MASTILVINVGTKQRTGRKFKTFETFFGLGRSESGQNFEVSQENVGLCCHQLRESHINHQIKDSRILKVLSKSALLADLFYFNAFQYTLTLLIPGLLGAPQYRGGLIRAPPPPPHNFSISYAFALKLVTGVHQRLVNTLVQKKI